MTEHTPDPVPASLTAPPEMQRDLTRIAWRVDRWIDLGPAAVLAGGTTAAAAAAALMPWADRAAGWEVLLGTATPGPLPWLFALVAGVALVVSGVALLVRFWPLAWAAGAVCGVAAVTGLWAIWARRTGLPADDVGPGLVVEVLAVLVLTGTWARIALSPPGSD
ncbi:Rv2732c family membrane protein [Pseudonocardia phyllosphaerae]|uniref:Rv2732c family membrane protein n=1 Tax=Pseudonocardia phyllosphaerae TaxID=3390502 RepID=UPI00397AFCC1